MSFSTSDSLTSTNAAKLEALNLIVQVPIFLPENTVRLGWTIAPSPGFEFALHALADNLDIETFAPRNSS